MTCLTYEAFAVEYVRRVKLMLSNPWATHLSAKVADLTDAYPEWTERADREWSSICD